MEEQISIIVPITVALLTGGFIILFLENQHVGANVIESNPVAHMLRNMYIYKQAS